MFLNLSGSSLLILNFYQRRLIRMSSLMVLVMTCLSICHPTRYWLLLIWIACFSVSTNILILADIRIWWCCLKFSLTNWFIFIQSHRIVIDSDYFTCYIYTSMRYHVWCLSNLSFCYQISCRNCSVCCLPMMSDLQHVVTLFPFFFWCRCHASIVLFIGNSHPMTFCRTPLRQRWFI